MEIYIGSEYDTLSRERVSLADTVRNEYEYDTLSIRSKERDSL